MIFLILSNTFSVESVLAAGSVISATLATIQLLATGLLLLDFSYFYLTFKKIQILPSVALATNIF